MSREGANAEGYWIRYIANSSTIRIESRADRNKNANFAQQALVKDAWNHVVITFDGSGDMSGFEVYVNNVKNTTPNGAVIDGSWLDASPVFEIGRRNTNASYYLGNMDELSFWNKTLDQAEVSLIFNSGTPDDISELVDYSANCTNFYRMGDDDVFPTMIDVKGGENGTMINMVAEDIDDDVQE